jgi:Kef-type K+ transport system membrane component KefB
MQITDLGPVDSELIWLVLAVLLAAIAGKMVAPAFVASRLSRRERWILGLALLPRGEVGLIVASIGLSQQHISHHGMVALLIMTLATALLPALLLPRFRA